MPDIPGSVDWLCTGYGVTAKRYDPATKRRVDHRPCGDDCVEHKKGECKPSATFYFYLPDVDVLAGFRLMTKSEATIGNIISTLKKITNAECVLSWMPCEFQIVEKHRKSDNKLYRILELMPPRYSLQQALEGNPVSAQAGQPGRVIYNTEGLRHEKRIAKVWLPIAISLSAAAGLARQTPVFALLIESLR